MRCLVPATLERLPCGSHTKELAGREHGYEGCQVFITRFMPGDGRAQSGEEGVDRLIFLCSGGLLVQVAGKSQTLQARSVVRLPGGLTYRLRNESPQEALCLEITSPSGSVKGTTHRLVPDLRSLVVTFEGHGPVESSKGFDYRFLADRRSGSANVALNIARVLPGHRGPDFHIHKFDQFYFVLSGRLSVQVGFEKFVAEPFSLVRLPAGIIHRQGNESAEIEEHVAIVSPEPAEGEPLDYQVAMPGATAGE